MESQDKSPDHLGIHTKSALRSLLPRLESSKGSSPLKKATSALTSAVLLIPRKIVRAKRKRDMLRFYGVHAHDIETLMQMAADETSREVIRTQLAFIKDYDYSGEQEYLRRSGLIETHADLLDTDEYFPSGIIHLDENEGFVDGGAFTGDTVREFCRRTNGAFSHIFSFEPDKANYPLLLAESAVLGLNSSQISCYQKGLYSSNETLHFDLRGIGSKISENGTETIEVVSLDDFLDPAEKSKITFVKLDVEGAELEALSGMKELIRTRKPKLAVCVYHKTEHFWQVPFLIRSLNPEYKFYFRQHALSRLETVCYAV